MIWIDLFIKLSTEVQAIKQSLSMMVYMNYLHFLVTTKSKQWKGLVILPGILQYCHIINDL